MKVFQTRQSFTEVTHFLRKHCELMVNEADRPLSADEIAKAAYDAEGLIVTGVDLIDKQLIQRLPQLKAICSMAVGYNNIDIQACSDNKITVTNAPKVLTETTADHAFALLLAAARRVGESERFLRSGLWESWSMGMLLGNDVYGSQLGILGMGRIGQAIAKRAAYGFGMKVYYHNRRSLPELEIQQCGNAVWLDKAALCKTVDHLIIVMPYSAATHHAIGAAELALMKPTATLVNIARGGIVDDAALAEALQQKRIAAAGLDVFEGEPLAINAELLKCENLVATPHIGSATKSTRVKMAKLAADNMLAILQGHPALTPVNLNFQVQA